MTVAYDPIYKITSSLRNNFIFPQMQTHGLAC